MRIGIDAGGTFTDFIIFHHDGRLETFKLRSSPRDPARVILEGLSRIAGSGEAEVVHGSTVATNALLERKGVRTAFVTTAGFEDLLHIGRQNRAELYNLTPALRRPLLAREDSHGIHERMLYTGDVLEAPATDEIRALADRLRGQGVRSVAVCLLHSYQNPEHEELVRDLLGDGFYLSISHEVSPEFREYERASTTALNAYVGPLMQDYLRELPPGIAIMQSNGGLMDTAQAGRHAVRTLLSGPAGGVIAASDLARRSGFTKVLGFDMGGTSTDVSLCDGEPKQAAEAYVDGFPLRVPVLDIHTVGAGGGSLARVDAGGLLRVGPESAGADPGPACYGQGTQATVTDAQVVLGRVAADQLAGGSVRIDPARAAAAVDEIANALKLTREQAAAGIIRVANANMERAIRAVSVERGFDPREFVLVAFGGGGGLHAAEIATELQIPTVLVPPYAGALSALGMLVAARVRDYAAGVLGRTEHKSRFLELEAQAARELPDAELRRSADVRYAGQSYELTIPWSASSEALANDFHAAHHALYGYADRGRTLEIVTLRLRATVPTPPINLPRPERRTATAAAPPRRLYSGGRWRQTPVYTRDTLPEDVVAGPALVLDYGSTTLVPPQWEARLDDTGALVLRRTRKDPAIIRK